MSPNRTPEQRPPVRRAPALAAKKCSGPCGRTLPLSSFDTAAGRKDGRRSDCKDCRRARRGPRGKEAQRAGVLAKELWVLRESFDDVPALAEVLSRAYEEVCQVGAGGANFAEQVEAIRHAVVVHGCRSADEVVEETGLSRKVVDRGLDKLVADKVLEPRDRFCLETDASDPGRPVTEYHPTDTPRGEVFSHILHRRAADDDLL